MIQDPIHTQKRGKIAGFYWISCTILCVLGFLFWFFFLRYREYTNDAYVEGNQVFITPLRPGFVTAIHTDDTFLVKSGQLLIQLDETDSMIALNQAKERLADVVRRVCQLFHDVFAYQAEIEVRRAEFIKTSQDFEHRENVLEAGGVSLEDYQHAVAAFRASFFSLEWTEILYDRALAAVQGTTIRNHPLVLEAADRVREAWVQLYRCKIYSPIEGLAAQRTIQVGMWAKAGEPLLSVIPLDQIWVNANYKETQLKRMRIGQKVKITSDLYGRDVIFQGTIVGLPGGAGNAFSLLPPQNLSGNWIKIVQRLPVRVALNADEIQEHPLRIGLSMEATVDLLDQGGALVPTTTAGSPTYQTPIFTKEEKGDEQLIEVIIQENLDPSLADFITEPLQIVHSHLPKPDSFEKTIVEEILPQAETPAPPQQLTKEEKPNDWLLTPPKTQHHRLFPLTPFPREVSMEKTEPICIQGLVTTPVFIALFAVLFQVIGSFTLTNMMSPYIVGDLGGSNDLTSYSISFFGLGTALSIPLGRVLLGHIDAAKMLVTCLVLYSVFAILCAFSTNYPFFLGTRFLQGLVSGPFFVVVQFIFSKIVPDENKDTFLAITIMLFATVPVISACWGGWIAYDYKWQHVFYADTALVLILSFYLWNKLKAHKLRLHIVTFDPIGYFFYFAGLFSLVFVVITGQYFDWYRSPVIVTMTLIGLPCFLFFILWDLHHPHPILYLRLLKKPILSFALFNLGMLFSAYFGMINLLALWLALDVNYTPIWIGTLLGIMAVAGIIPPFLIKHRLGRVDCRVALCIAVIFFAVSCFHTTTFDVEIDFQRIVISRFISGLGLAFFIPPLVRLCLLNFPSEWGLHVMSLFHTVRATCSALGVAVYSTIWQRRQVFFHDRLGGDLTPFSQETKDFFVRAEELKLQPEQSLDQLNFFLTRRATSLALDDCFYLMAWLMIGLLVLLAFTLFLRKEPFWPEKYKNH